MIMEKLQAENAMLKAENTRLRVLIARAVAEMATGQTDEDRRAWFRNAMDVLLDIMFGK